MTQDLLGEDAVLDLEDIWDYIADGSADAADRLLERLFEAFEALGRMPRMCHRREDLTPHAVLFWSVGSYVIIYRAQNDPARIRQYPAFTANQR